LLRPEEMAATRETAYRRRAAACRAGLTHVGRLLAGTDVIAVDDGLGRRAGMLLGRIGPKHE
jgi:hypothetical protein